MSKQDGLHRPHHSFTRSQYSVPYPRSFEVPRQVSLWYSWQFGNQPPLMGDFPRNFGPPGEAEAQWGAGSFLASPCGPRPQMCVNWLCHRCVDCSELLWSSGHESQHMWFYHMYIYNIIMHTQTHTHTCIYISVCVCLWELFRKKHAYVFYPGPLFDSTSKWLRKTCVFEGFWIPQRWGIRCESSRNSAANENVHPPIT